MAAKILCRSLELEPLYGFVSCLVQRKDPTHVLISFWCDSDNKNYDFSMFQNFSRFFNFVHFGYHQNLLISHTPLLGVFPNICSMHIGPKEFAR